MSKPIEDYAIIGDCRTAALVARDGSIDWLCLPRFDSRACFSALLGDESHGCWTLLIDGSVTRRRYRPRTLILETDWQVRSGAVRVIDFMPIQSDTPCVVRMVEGLEGEVSVRSRVVCRLDYGSVTPWIRPEGGFVAIGGPDRIHVQADVKLEQKENSICGGFAVRPGERVVLRLWLEDSAEAIEKKGEFDWAAALERTEGWWNEWCGQCSYEGAFKEEVMRSLLTLKALTYARTGGIVAAATTSLPEDIGGVRNWDYRFCWIRDSSLVLYSLIETGYTREARAWYAWLMRAVAGDAAQMQIMYGPDGRRRLTESKADWLPGYENSQPVLLGNHAYQQHQHDVYGEVMAAYYLIRQTGVWGGSEEWDFILGMMDCVEALWKEPDEGIWEVREERRHFTYSKFMCWVAFDRALQAATEFSLPGPLDKWKRLRDRIHKDVCRNGFNKKMDAFTQAYGTEHLDASLLRMPLEGFLPVDDPRIQGTIRAIEEHLINKTFVFRYYPSHEVDGLPGSEGAFILCNFWLVDVYLLAGRSEDAHRLFGELRQLANDVGLLSEEFDPKCKRLIGNFPQALSHTGLIMSAHRLSGKAPLQTRTGKSWN